jgi:hypothetical protein
MRFGFAELATESFEETTTLDPNEPTLEDIIEDHYASNFSHFSLYGSSKVLGGTTAVVGQFPYFIGIEYLEKDSTSFKRCSGALL